MCLWAILSDGIGSRPDCARLHNRDNGTDVTVFWGAFYFFSSMNGAMDDGRLQYVIFHDWHFKVLLLVMMAFVCYSCVIHPLSSFSTNHKSCVIRVLFILFLASQRITSPRTPHVGFGLNTS